MLPLKSWTPNVNLFVCIVRVCIFFLFLICYSMYMWFVCKLQKYVSSIYFGFQSFSCSFCFMRWFIDFYQSHASSCWCYAYACVYSIYALTTHIWSYMRMYLFVLLVVYWSSRCLVTKLLHLFVWLTAWLFDCMYDCCLSIHFFALLIYHLLRWFLIDLSTYLSHSFPALMNHGLHVPQQTK